MHSHRVAVVGAGPSGLYAVAALTAADRPADRPVHVDVIDRLPTPFGLVRYGVAPDHQKIKLVTKVLAKPLEAGQARYLGNVVVGTDIDHSDLLECYDAVIYATGAEKDRTLPLPGQGIPGTFGALEIVRWYNGHPHAATSPVNLAHECAVVIGGGNVALDLARVLTRPATDMLATDVPTHVLEELDRSNIRDVHVLIRRGPAEAKFTSRELGQLAHISDVDVTVHNAWDLDHAPHDSAPSDRPDARVAENLEIFRRYAAPTSPAAPPVQSAARRIHFHFHATPTEIHDTEAETVTGVTVETTHASGAVGRHQLEAGLVVSAIGFHGTPVPGLPFDEEAGIVPNRAGRVLLDGQELHRVYVTGWLKRGATGVIGTNKPDGFETAAAVLADLDHTPTTARPDLLARLQCSNVTPTDWSAWLKIHEHEKSLGATHGRPYAKLADLDSMLEHCTG